VGTTSDGPIPEAESVDTTGMTTKTQDSHHDMLMSSVGIGDNDVQKMGEAARELIAAVAGGQRVAIMSFDRKASGTVVIEPGDLQGSLERFAAIRGTTDVYYKILLKAYEDHVRTVSDRLET
jgi:hypothetical protein